MVKPRKGATMGTVGWDLEPPGSLRLLAVAALVGVPGIPLLCAVEGVWV